MIRGSCLCGGVAWRFDAPLELMSHCHCSMCRKTHGTAFGTYATASTESFGWQCGEGLVTDYESSPGNVRPFCSRCGSVVPRQLENRRIVTPVGNLDDDPGTRPIAHIFAASKAPWHGITDSIPRFDAMPPGIPVPEIDRSLPAVARTGALRGSCLCGDIAYEVSGASRGIVKCHCSRCRKSRSAAHATNLFLADPQFEFICGDTLIDSYKVPDAERFTSFFCRRCGSIVPNGRISRGQTMLPAGSIDGGAALEEKIHIFVGSKAPWHEISDSLPQLEGAPGGSGSRALEAKR